MFFPLLPELRNPPLCNLNRNCIPILCKNMPFSWLVAYTVVFKLVTDRHFYCGFFFFTNYRYRIVLPEELIAITETDLWECQQKLQWPMVIVSSR